MKTKIYNCSSIWPSKVNFIDSNNIILGYDLAQDCCEYAFWSINTQADGEGKTLYQGDADISAEWVLENYVFDPGYYQNIDKGEDGCAAFRLVNNAYLSEEPRELFIILENHQNGYYGHGFTFRGSEIIEGVL